MNPEETHDLKEEYNVFLTRDKKSQKRIGRARNRTWVSHTTQCVFTLCLSVFRLL